MLTTEQSLAVVSRIISNESRAISMLTDNEIKFYLVDAGCDDTVDNVQIIRAL